MSDAVNREAPPPVAARLVRSSSSWDWAVACPHCKEPHRHVAVFIPSNQHPREGLTQRVAPCRKRAGVSDEARKIGYQLVEVDRDETDRLVAEYEEQAKARQKARVTGGRS